jgi:hypothetical protein
MELSSALSSFMRSSMIGATTMKCDCGVIYQPESPSPPHALSAAAPHAMLSIACNAAKLRPQTAETRKERLRIAAFTFLTVPHDPEVAPNHEKCWVKTG